MAGRSTARLQRLRAHGHVFEQDGATWFRATAFGDEKDRVVVRANGQKTYFASDIAYHLDKRERGFDQLVTILGADHHGYVARVRAGLAAMGEPPESLQVPMVQFVTLFKGGEKVAMGKREAQFVTLRELRTEVGNDAARLIYVMRSNDQPLDFDLELAKKQSNDNPVYYIQYAHARIASVLKQAAERGLPFDRAAGIAALAGAGRPGGARADARDLALAGSRAAGRGTARAASRRALPARARAGVSRLLCGAAVHRRGREAAQCAASR